MNVISKSFKAYSFLILILAISAAVVSVMPMGMEIQGMENMQLPAPPLVIALANFFIMIIVYGGLGIVGIFLGEKTIIPDLWNDKITNKQRFIIPFIIGSVCGLFMIATDQLFFHFTDLDHIPHPIFPASVFASATAGIGEEIIFRLFFISFWLWLIGKVLFKAKHYQTIYWVLAVFSILLFTGAHLPSVILLYDIKDVSNFPVNLLLEVFIINAIVSFATIWYFKKNGILAAILIHFWADIIWHTAYGFFT